MIRILAIAVIVLVAAYFVMRTLATACAGSGCDVYIPISLLLPILIFLASAMTAVVAIASARGLGAWFAVLILSTALAVLGPIVALAYSFFGRRAHTPHI